VSAPDAGELAREASPLCPFCGEPGRVVHEDVVDALFGVPGRWTFKSCLREGVLWLDPRPTREAIGRAYERYYTHDDTPADAPLAGVARLIAGASFGYRDDAGLVRRAIGALLALDPGLFDMAGAQVAWLDARGRGRLLELGCGCGDLLVRMQALGWEVAGIESDPHAAALARGRLGARVACGTIDDGAVEDRSCDAIALHHVLEHVHDPRAALAWCRRVLRPGGRLSIAVPNPAGLGHWGYGGGWRGLEPPRHLSLFDARALCGLLGEYGFRVDRLRTTTECATEVWCHGRLLRRGSLDGRGLAPHLGLRLHAEGRLFRLAEELARGFWPGVGEAIAVVATREAA
jgi:SAM-dependent methyltransferase